MRLLVAITSAAILSSRANGDACKEMCEMELGRSKCTPGSYCKANNICHLIHWMGKNRKEITAAVGADKYGIVVKCTEAADWIRTKKHQPKVTAAKPKIPVTPARQVPTDPPRPRYTGQDYFDYFNKWRSIGL
jgi:hypothetical protein